MIKAMIRDWTYRKKEPTLRGGIQVLIFFSIVGTIFIVIPFLITGSYLAFLGSIPYGLIGYYLVYLQRQGN